MSIATEVADGRVSGSVSYSPSSFGSSLHDDGPSHPPKREADFVDVVSTISKAYQRKRYLQMRSLNNIEWDQLGRGAHFQVSRSELSFEVVSATTGTVTEKILDHFVIKRARDSPRRRMTARECTTFIRELRVLDHLHAHEQIVTLKGIAWFYEHDDDLQPCPKPVLLLEKASTTLDSLVLSAERLDPDATANIFLDISVGLDAMHRAGIVHGDIKPENVLLFPHFYHADRTVEGFCAKLSDFSNAILQPSSGDPDPYHGGTPGYIAPELPGSRTWAELRLTDVWSLGMLFSVVASQSFEFRDMAAGATLPVDTLILIIRESFRQNIENSAMSLERSLMVQTLFACTLQRAPEERSLDRLIHSLEQYALKQNIRSAVDMLRDCREEQVTISYHHFRSLSGSVKQVLVDSLQAASEDETDPRCATALFELATIALSQYANPMTNAREGLAYLQRAAELGSTFDPRPRALYARIQGAFSDNALIDHIAEEGAQWLFESATRGHRTAFEDLLRNDPKRASLALSKKGYIDIGIGYCGPENDVDKFRMWINRTVGKGSHIDQLRTEHGHTVLHWAAATGQAQLIYLLDSEYATLLDTRSATGDTALLVAASYGQMESVLALLDLGADASILNDYEENIFHYLWCFTLEDAQTIIPNALACNAVLDQEAKERPFAGLRDTSPLVSGTPVERLAGRNRLDLVELLVYVFHATIGDSRNGNTTRRMLRLATRLHNHRLQRFLITYFRNRSSYEDLDLKDLYQTDDVSYVCDAAAGWISGVKLGTLISCAQRTLSSEI